MLNYIDLDNSKKESRTMGTINGLHWELTGK